MARTYRATMAALIACLFVVQSTSTLFASETDQAAPPSKPGLTFEGKPLVAAAPLTTDEMAAVSGSISRAPAESSASGQWGGGPYGRRGRNTAAATAILLGAVGTIAGTALLVYAARPDCTANPELGGCGYGTKVVGGAVLSAGLVGVMVGALTWR